MFFRFFEFFFFAGVFCDDVAVVVVHVFLVFEHGAEDFFVGTVAFDFVCSSGLEEFDDAVVGIAF